MVPRGRTHRTRDERGVALPSPVVLLSIVAIALAAVAFVVTAPDGEKERDITPAAESAASGSPSPTATASPEKKSQEKSEKKAKKPAKPQVNRAETYVVVFNNTNITGLAGQVGDRAAAAGWNVVGADDWLGTIPANTVYYPPNMAAAGKQLALDLGIERTHPADPGSMQMDRLTVILVGPIS